MITRGPGPQVGDAGERGAIRRSRLHQREQFDVVDDMTPGAIATPRLAFAPGRQFAECRELPRAQAASALDATVLLFRRRLLRGLREDCRHLGRDPVGAPQARAGLDQLVIHRKKMLHIGRRVSELSRRQRSLQPVGAGLLLADFETQQALYQRAVTQRKPVADHGRRDLRVVQGRGPATQRELQHLQIFRAGVQHLDHVRIGQQRPQGAQIAQRHRIDEPGGVAIAHLDQRQTRIKGIRAHELGIEGDRRATTPVRRRRDQLRGPGDQVRGR